MSLAVKLIVAVAWVFLARSFVVNSIQNQINKRDFVTRNTPFFNGENIVTFLEIVVFILM